MKNCPKMKMYITGFGIKTFIRKYFLEAFSKRSELGVLQNFDFCLSET